MLALGASRTTCLLCSVILTRNSFVREISEDEMNMAQNLTTVGVAFYDFESCAKTQDWSALHV
jgi:hypothetical protein